MLIIKGETCVTLACAHPFFVFFFAFLFKAVPNYLDQILSNSPALSLDNISAMLQKIKGEPRQ